MRYYIIAGEASGDLHGSNLMKSIKVHDKNASFRFFGGDLMAGVDSNLVKHYREMAFMGIINVLLNLKTIKRNLSFCQEDILNFKPDVLILIDYPGFNLRVAKFAKENGIKVFYYISPKVWAWKEYRVKLLKAYVDEIFTILPFETEFFKKHGIDVNYVGNPVLGSVEEFRKNAISRKEFLQKNELDDKPIVALLSGSRKQEVRNTLPVMRNVTKSFPDFQFVVAGVPFIKEEFYRKILDGSPIRLIFDQTYDLLGNSHAALVASGTATLETALFNIPQAVLYRVEGGWLVQVIMKNFFLKIKWASLTNLILNKEAIREFIQLNMKEKKVFPELKKLLYDEKYRKKIIDDYDILREKLGKPGASENAAAKMVSLLKADV